MTYEEARALRRKYINLAGPMLVLDPKPDEKGQSETRSHNDQGMLRFATARPQAAERAAPLPNGRKRP